MENEADLPELKNDLIFRVIRGEKVERTPIWIMRQAGRYLPEFREVRKENDFFKMVQTPEICCKITLQPIERYNFDAAIIFSDILIICQAIGMKVQMLPGRGPVFDSPLKEPSDIKNLNFNIDAKTAFRYLLEGIKLTRIQLEGRCPLIGFCGAPWTLMCYMTDTSEGGAKNFSSSRKWLYAHSSYSKQLLKDLAQIIADLLVEQAKSGAQILMLFESHAEILNLTMFMEFEWIPIITIYDLVRQKGIDTPIMFYIKGGHYIINDLIETSPFEVIGFDWTIDPIKLINTTKTLMGNMDPAALYGTNEQISQVSYDTIKSFSGHRHIFNLGHGIYPDISPESVEYLVKLLRK